MGTVVGKNMTVGMQSFHSVSGPIMGRDMTTFQCSHFSQ